MLKFANIELIDGLGESLLAPPISPRARRGQLLESLATSPEAVTYTGTSASYITRWTSGTNHGLLPYAKIRALIDLYDTGQPFTITTDYLREVDNVATYTGCYFSPGETPVFTPSEAFGYYLVDMLIRIPVGAL